MTEAYNASKEKIKEHVNSSKNNVVIFSWFGMTSAINKLHRILGIKICGRLKGYLKIPEEIRPVVFVTHMEHHSNYLSWLETISDVVVIETDYAYIKLTLLELINRIEENDSFEMDDLFKNKYIRFDVLGFEE